MPRRTYPSPLPRHRRGERGQYRARRQVGKGGKRLAQWHSAAQKGEWRRALELLPDVQVPGVNYTAAEPQRVLHRGNRTREGAK